MNYLEKWAQSILRRTSNTLKTPVEIEAERDAHLGPRWEYAKIKLRIEPAETFEVRSEVQITEDTVRQTYLDATIMGLLDVLLVAEESPLIRISVNITALEEHEVDSTPMAFRMAGREAGKKLLKAAREQAFAPPT
jgi:Elongation factor G, domain IV